MAQKPEPQAGILPEPSPNAAFLILRVHETRGVGKVLAGVPALTAKVGAADPRARLVCTVGIGSECWDTISHVARTVIEENGEELKIMRHSFPYGTVSEAGLFFIAYTRTLDIPEKMLARMLGASGDGLYDRLMEFSHAVSGATFFAPSLNGLKTLGAR